MKRSKTKKITEEQNIPKRRNRENGIFDMEKTNRQGHIPEKGKENAGGKRNKLT